MRMPSRPRTLGKTFRWPAVLAALTLAALLLGFMAEGVADIVAVAALGVPLVICVLAALSNRYRA